MKLFKREPVSGSVMVQALKIQLLFLGCLCISSTSAVAAEGTIGSRLFGASLNKAALTTTQGRLAFAKAVNSYCTEVQTVYPRNSPSEERWLDGEISGSGNRAVKALTSPELGRRIAKTFVDGCITTSDWAIKKPDKSIYFVILAHDFIRFSGDASYYAKLNSVNHEQFMFDGAPRNASEALIYAAMMIEIEEESS